MIENSYTKKAYNIHADIKVYASGSGALSFVWSSRGSPDIPKNNATGDKVTLDDVLGFLEFAPLYKKFKLVEIFEEYHLIENIKENNGFYLIDGKKFKVKKDESRSFGLLVTRYGYEVHHLSTKASLKFFIENKDNMKVINY